jgi:hypothetical protein
MKTIRSWRNMFLGLAVAVMVAGTAQAQTASYVDTPLMVVRFNQSRVYYQQPLFNAVSRALEAKPDVIFNVITVVPQTGSSHTNEKFAAEARRDTSVFVTDMVKMGIPQSRIHVSYQNAPNVESNEVHLFVE